MVLWFIVRVLDAKLRRVLILAGFLDDDHQAVVRRVGFQVFTGGPFECALVVDLVRERVDGFHVLAGAAQQHDRDRARRVGFPFDRVGLSGFDGVVDAGLGDRVAFGWVVVVGGCVCCCCCCQEGCKE